MLFTDYQARVIHARTIADRLDSMIRERANRNARRAGLDPARNVWHNAMVARAEGRPWPNVNYSDLRAAIRADESRSRVSDLVSTMQARLWPQVQR